MKISLDSENNPIPSTRDFGGLSSKTPKEIRYPTSTLELAETLKYFNDQNTPVVVRNTGHSVNGQTTTDGVQINLSRLIDVNVDWEKGTVTVGAGCSWDKLLKAIKFPLNCTPIFPNNPNQEIHVGGTTAVGGVGFFSAERGGYWHTVRSITLVTMEGKIMECSPEVNSDYFYFSLGGFGRIGVIASITLPFQEVTPKLLSCALVYHDPSSMIKDAYALIRSNSFTSVTMVHNMMHLFPEQIPIHPSMIMVMKEVTDDNEMEEMMVKLKKECHQDFAGYLDFVENKPHVYSASISYSPKHLNRHDIVYWYPDVHSYDENECHPWSDYFIPPQHYNDFAEFAAKRIIHYDLKKFLLPQKVNHILTCHLEGAYPIRCLNNEAKFPLCLGNTPHDFMVAYGVFPTIPRSKLPDVIKLTKELTDLAYDIGGKRYMYGLHDLSKEQIVKQYTSDVIDKWQKLKDELDPKHLLNIGVIPHLDA